MQHLPGKDIFCFKGEGSELSPKIAIRYYYGQIDRTITLLPKDLKNLQLEYELILLSCCWTGKYIDDWKKEQAFNAKCAIGFSKQVMADRMQKWERYFWENILSGEDVKRAANNAARKIGPKTEKALQCRCEEGYSLLRCGE